MYRSDSGYANQLAPSHREIPAAIGLLKMAWNFDYRRLLHHEHVRDLAFGAVCVLGGISPQDLLRFSLQDGKKSVAGRIEAGRLFIYVGSGIHPGLLGRVPFQTLEIPLPVRCVELLIEVAKRFPGARSVSDCYFEDPLGTILGSLARLSHAECELCGFLHRPFIYAALNFAKVSPGVCQLMLARPIGPYRSALNYTSVSHTLIWREMVEVQRLLLNLAELEGTWTAINGIGLQGARTGAVAPRLKEAVTASRETVRKITNTNELAAAVQLGPAFHGRRPTQEQSPPITSADALIVSDKNHGSGRRLRTLSR